MQPIKKLPRIQIEGMLVTKMATKITTQLQSARDEMTTDKNNLIENAFDAMPNAIVVVDQQVLPVLINKVAKNIKFDDILLGEFENRTRPIRFLYSDGTPYTADSSPLRRSVIFGETYYALNCTVASSDNRQQSFLIDTVPLFDCNGQPNGAIGIGREMVTEERQYEAQVLPDAKLQSQIHGEQRLIDKKAARQPDIRNNQGDSVETHKKLVTQSLEAIEADRKMVAKELHDSIGASLAAIKLNLEEQQVKISQLPSDVKVSLEKPISYLIKAIKETKRISVQMSPLILDELGLLATIQWYSREFAQLYPQTEIHHRIDIHEKEIPANHKITIYRILQEAVNNAAKHGNAKSVVVSLKRVGHRIKFGIEDNGCGFDVQRIAMEDENVLSGYGIAGMRDRINLCGGVFDLKSSPGSGTRIIIELPCSAEP